MTDQPDAKTFRDAMRAFVGNCSVLTVGDGDQANGLVITSGISLSADPALILACVNRSSRSGADLGLRQPLVLQLAPVFPRGRLWLVLARRRPSGRCRAFFGLWWREGPGPL